MKKFAMKIVSLFLIIAMLAGGTGIEVLAETDIAETSEMYVEFDYISHLPTLNTTNGYAFSSLNLSYGRLIQEADGTYSLQIDVTYQSYTKKDGANGTPFIMAKELGYLNEENQEISILESLQDTGREVVSAYTSSSVTYCQVYTAKIPLNIREFSQIEGKEVVLTYNRMTSAKRKETITLKLKAPSSEKPVVEPELIPYGYTLTSDGSYGPIPGNNSKERSLQYYIRYPVTDGLITWYYTLGEEEITEDSANNTYNPRTQSIQAEKQEAYTATLRIKGKNYDDGSWTNEYQLQMIPFSKEGIGNGVLQDSTTGVSVIGLQNVIPYDTVMTAPRVTDTKRLESVGQLLKETAGEDYGSFRVYDISVKDPDGNPIVLLNETGEWGSGLYAVDSKTSKKQIYFDLTEEDMAEGFNPVDCQIYRLKDGKLQELHMYPTTNSMKSCYGSYSENEDPSGTYVLMRKPLSSLAEAIDAGNYKVPVQFVSSKQDDNGNTVDQWFTKTSALNAHIGGNAVIRSEEDGTKEVYISLIPSDGQYISALRYSSTNAENIEQYSGQYPKTAKITLNSDDVNSAYINLQVKVTGESGWQDVVLALNYSDMYTYEAGVELSSPVIATETGAVNFVNDAQAVVAIQADAVDGKIYYTTDGTEPTAETGTLYENAFQLSTANKEGQSYEVKAIVVKEGYSASAVSSQIITFKKEGESAETVKTPVITARYDYAKDNNGTTADTGYYTVSFTTETEDAKIYYTIDGSVPTADSTVYDGTAVSVPAQTNGKATVIQAIAVKDGYNDSEVSNRTISFSTEWWDNLEEGDSYQVPVQMVNIGIWQNQGLRVDSMGAGGIKGDATVYVKDGQKYLEVSLQGLNVGGIPGYLIGMWYWDNNDDNTGEKAGKFSTTNTEGAIEADYVMNEDGTIKTVTIPLFSDFEQVFVGLESNVSLMGKQGTILWLDYSDVIETITGKEVEKEVAADTPEITYQYDEEKDSYTVTITAEEGADIQYSVSTAEDTFDWQKYEGAFTISGTDAKVKDGMVNIMAKADVEGKETSQISSLKFTFADFGKEKETLADGTYTVDVTMRNASNPDEKSMSNEAVVKPMKVTVKDGSYTAIVDFQGINIDIAGQTLFGYMKKLFYKNKNGDYVEATVNSYYDVVDDFNKNTDGTAAYQYPKQVTFPLINGEAGDADGYVDLQVFVPIMDSIAAGTGTQKVYMDIDWSSAKLVDNTADPEPAKPTLKASAVKLSNKTATYSGKAISIGKATVTGSKGTVTYTYYTDKKCTKKTTSANGVSKSGAAPKNAGTYYVKASVAAKGEYKAATSNIATLKINQKAAALKVKSASVTKTYGAKAFTNTLTKTTDGKITYKSSDSKVAAINSKGKVTIKGAGKATITIKAAAGKNYKAKTITYKLTVKPGKVKVSSAKNTKKGVITVKWPKATAVGKTTSKTKYYVEYSTSKKFTKKTTKTIKVAGSKTSTQIKSLKKGKTYYVRVRAYNSALKKYGSYSAVKTVKITK